jgi:hypothetical protein
MFYARSASVGCRRQSSIAIGAGYLDSPTTASVALASAWKIGGADAASTGAVNPRAWRLTV